MSEILSHQPAAEAVGVLPKLEPLVDVSEVPVSVSAEESPDGKGILGVEEATTEAIVGQGTVSQAEETKLEPPKFAVGEEQEEPISLGSTDLPEKVEESVEKAHLNGALTAENSVAQPVQIEKTTRVKEHEVSKEYIEVEKPTAAAVPVQVPILEVLPKPTPDSSVVPPSKVENEVKAEASAPVDVSTNSEKAKPVVEVSKEVSVPITAEPEATKQEEVKVEKPVVVKTTEHTVVAAATKTTTTAVASDGGVVSTSSTTAALETSVKTTLSETKKEEHHPTIKERLEEDSTIVKKELVKGAEDTLVTVKAHPELIAEGVLAGVIGAASLVQPELVAGEVAVIGTMAKTAAQKGAISIAQTEGKKLVQAVAQDVKESDTAAKADVKDVKSDEKDANAEGTDEKTKTPATETTPSANGGKTISIEVAQPQDTTKAASETQDKKSDAEPVSLKITIGADGEVKAVTKAAKEEPKVSETSTAAAPDVLPSKTEVLAKEIPVVAETDATNLVSTSVPEGPSKIEPSKAETKDLVSEPVVEEVKTKALILKEEATKPASEAVIKQVEAQNSTSKENGVQSTAAAVSLPEPAPTKQVNSSSIEALPIAISAITTAATVSNTTAEAPKPVVEAPPPVPTVTITQESLDALHHKIDTLHLSIQEISKTLALHLPHLVYKSASVIETPEPAAEPTPEIVAKPASSDHIPEIIAEPVFTPSSPEIIEAPAETSTVAAVPQAEPEPEPSSPKTSVSRKRTSTLGYIGKILWPFGSGSGSPKETTPAPAQDENEDAVSVPIAEATTVAACE